MARMNMEDEKPTKQYVLEQTLLGLVG